jgi:hypothetical protein
MIISGRVLLLGRFAMAVCELCPHLAQCMLTSDKVDSKSVDLIKMNVFNILFSCLSWRILKKTPMKRPSPSADDPKWIQMKNDLQDFSNDAFRLFSVL